MVVVSENGLSFEVKSIVEEHNHENSQILFQHLPKERRIPNEYAKETELLFKLQANKKLMRDHLEAKTGKKIILKDLSNLKSCSKKESLCDDFESLVGKLAGPKGSVVEILTDENNILQCLFYQDQEMKDMFAAYPKILFIDATYKVNNLRMPLYVLMVEDSCGQSEVVGICLTSTEDQLTITSMAEPFKKNNEAYERTKAIMADKDFNERQYFAKTFPNAKLLVCHFHVLRTFRREITTEKLGITSSERQTALELLEKLTYSCSEEEYQLIYSSIKSSCPSQVVDYISNNWNHIRNEWVFGLKMAEGTYLNNTNNRLESFNQKMKSVVMINSSMSAFFDGFLSLMRTIRNERDHKGIVGIQKIRTNPFTPGSPEQLYSRFHTEYAAKLVIDHIKRSKKLTLQKDGDETYVTCVMCRSIKLPLSSDNCTCIFRVSMGLPCQHIFAARIENGMYLFDHELCNERWTMAFYKKKMRGNVEDETEANKTLLNVEVMEDKRTILSENQKYRKAISITNQLASLVAESSMREFGSRLEVLKSLVDVWTKNGTATLHLYEDTGGEALLEDILGVEGIQGTSEEPLTNQVAGETAQLTLDSCDSFPLSMKGKQKKGDGKDKEVQPDKPTTSTSGVHVSENIKDISCHDTDANVQEFLYKIADASAVRRAEANIGKIEEDEVEVTVEELLPHAEILLNLQLQSKAKDFFTSDGWLTVESTLYILEEQHLKLLKRREFPPMQTDSKGEGKRSKRKIPSDGTCPSLNKKEKTQELIPMLDNEFQQMMEDIKVWKVDINNFLENCSSAPIMPKIGEPIQKVNAFQDKTREITEEQRSTLTRFLCQNFNQINFKQPDVSSLIHATITFILDLHKKKELDVTHVKEVKFRPVFKKRGKPKGSLTTVIGLPKKGKRTSKVPFLKRSLDIKENEILGWIFSVSDIQKAKEGELIMLIGPDLVSSLTADTLSYRLLDDAVDIRTIKRFFSEEGWTSFLAILEEKKSFNEILCTFCNHVKDCNAMGVFCDGCLLWSHLKCVVLKAVPKTKYWFCRSCR